MRVPVPSVHELPSLRCGTHAVSLAMNGDYTGSQCESHWRNVRTTLKRGPWTAEEDASLHRAVQLYSAATETIPWKKVAPLIPGRTNVQCRDRWLVVSGIRRGLAKPKKNPPWKDDEDATLREAIGDQWNKKKPDVDWLEVAQSVGRKDRNVSLTGVVPPQLSC